MNKIQLQEMIDDVTKGGGRFGDNQIDQIRFGFEHKLNIEQIKMYAKPEFNY